MAAAAAAAAAAASAAMLEAEAASETEMSPFERATTVGMTESVPPMSSWWLTWRPFEAEVLEMSSEQAPKDELTTAFCTASKSA